MAGANSRLRHAKPQVLFPRLPSSTEDRSDHCKDGLYLHKKTEKRTEGFIGHMHGWDSALKLLLSFVYCCFEPIILKEPGSSSM